LFDLSDIYDIITPAIKYNTYCHSGERRNPGVHWMPDQVRQDGSVPLNCRVNNTKLDKTLQL
jgi:hypothetical protein